MRLKKPWHNSCNGSGSAASPPRTGAPHLTPVCQVVAGGKIYFAVGSDSKKASNLRRNPRLALLADRCTEDWPHLAGVMIQGRAKLIERGPQFRKIRALLYKKFPQYPNAAALEEGGSLIVEVAPERVASWGID